MIPTSRVQILKDKRKWNKKFVHIFLPRLELHQTALSDLYFESFPIQIMKQLRYVECCSFMRTNSWRKKKTINSFIEHPSGVFSELTR